MNRSKLLRLAAIALLPALSWVGAAQATTYNLSQDWNTAFPTSTSTLTSPTFGYQGAWSVGQLSSNWLNIGGDERTFQNFWTAASGNITSGGSAAGNVVTATTGTYTVPFAFYQATPGTTNQVNVGLTLPMQVASGQIPYEPVGQSPQDKITNPSGSTDSVSAGNGYMSYNASASNAGGSASVHGFSTNALQNTSANDGSGTVRDITGIFDNYSTTSVKVSGSEVIAPAGSNDLLNSWSTFGPWAAQWTAPTNGMVTISTIFTDTNYNNGASEFAVLSANFLQTTAPSVLLFGTAGGMTSSVGGTVTNTAVGNPNGPYGQYWAGGSTSGYEYAATQWLSSTISVTAGETLYFATSGAGQGQSGGGGGHPWGGASDPGTIAATIVFTPEPSSVVLLGMAGVGLALAARKRCRLAA